MNPLTIASCCASNSCLFHSFVRLTSWDFYSYIFICQPDFCFHFLSTHVLALWRIDRRRLPRPVVTLVVLRGLVRGSTMKQLRVHDKSDIDGSLPPPVPRRHLVLKKERDKCERVETAAGVTAAPFPADLNYPGSFSCQGQRTVHSINQARVTRFECPPTPWKRERAKESEVQSKRERRDSARISDYS